MSDKPQNNNSSIKILKSSEVEQLLKVTKGNKPKNTMSKPESIAKVSEKLLSNITSSDLPGTLILALEPDNMFNNLEISKHMFFFILIQNLDCPYLRIEAIIEKVQWHVTKEYMNEFLRLIAESKDFIIETPLHDKYHGLKTVVIYYTIPYKEVLINTIKMASEKLDKIAKQAEENITKSNN